MTWARTPGGSTWAPTPTPEFAVESIHRWWTTTGRLAYPQADRLLITADGGGPGGSRLRLWKTQLAQLAAETGLEITVCHLPPGTSRSVALGSSAKRRSRGARHAPRLPERPPMAVSLTRR